MRDGRQNVASLYEMARNYPDRFWAKYRSLDTAIERWKAYIESRLERIDF